MDLVTIDWETYYDNEYSLSKMSPLAYVMDDRFEAISVSIKVNDRKTGTWFGDEISNGLATIDWSKAFTVGHNMLAFDSYVMAYRYGINPAMWGCTLAMARAVLSKTHPRLSLGSLVEAFNIGVKNSAILTQTKGKRLKDFTQDEIRRMGIYNAEDTDQDYELFKILRKFFSAKELWHIDACIRMRTEPQFELDFGLLETAASVERTRKHKALLDLFRTLKLSAPDCEQAEAALMTEDQRVEAIKAELSSSAKFASLLERLGVEVPMKPSPSNPNKQVLALAKTDQAMEDLQEHEDDLVAAAARCRLDVKSTLLETRIEKFIAAGRAAGGKLPVPLRPNGADTTGRDSGEEYNCFTGETEVLTLDGWKRFDSWSGEPIMQWWPDGRTSFEGSPGVLVKDYTGPIVDVDAVLFSSSMTPEHRIVHMVEDRAVERTAQWLADHGRLDGIPAGGVWDGAKTSLFTPDEVRLLVAIAADATVVPRKTQRPTIQIGLRRPRKVERLRQLLSAVGCKYTERQYPAQAGHKGDHPTTVFFLPDCEYGKGFGSWILGLSREALDAFMDEVPHWDGWLHHSGQQTEFATSSREQAEWFATAVHLSGKATTIRQYKGCYQMHVRVSNRTSVGQGAVVTRQHSGKVYCAGVESSYILIRRNGKIAVAGQCQNLPRINKKKPKTTDALRRSLRAPKGKKVIVADQSGIELRVNHFLWKVQSSMALYQSSPDKADLYRSFASKSLFMIPEEEIDKDQRQLGKVAQLGLGFGAGAPTFKRVAKTMGGIVIPLSRDETTPTGVVTAEETVFAWRSAYSEIVGGWKSCAIGITDVHRGIENAIDPWGLVITTPDGFRLPSGRLIRYPDLRQEDDGEWPDGRPKKSWFYGIGRAKARITGPKGCENIVQALARDSIFDVCYEFFRLTGLRPALRVHDELVYVVDEDKAEELLQLLQALLRQPPKWWPELVTWSEGDIADTYGDAK